MKYNFKNVGSMYHPTNATHMTHLCFGGCVVGNRYKGSFDRKIDIKKAGGSRGNINICRKASGKREGYHKWQSPSRCKTLYDTSNADFHQVTDFCRTRAQRGSARGAPSAGPT